MTKLENQMLKALQATTKIRHRIVSCRLPDCKTCHENDKVANLVDEAIAQYAINKDRELKSRKK